MQQPNSEEIRAQLLADDLGFHVVRNLYSPEEIDRYRAGCERFLKEGPIIQTRINTDWVPDYIHHRTHDKVQRTQRIYQYFHNHKDDDVGRFFRRATQLRDEIESGWLDDPIYRSEKELLQDYVIVTHYAENAGMLPKHRDYSGPAPKPLIQFWVLLSDPEKDYCGGNLVLYSRDGTRRRVEADLGVRQGDALIFDKSLEHEVEMTQAGVDGGIGRWTVLIGARAKRDTPWRARFKRVAYDRRLFRATRAVKYVLSASWLS